MIKKGTNIVAHIVLIFLCILCVVPFLLLISSSLTDETVLLSTGYSLIPGKFSLDAYKYVFSGAVGKIANAYGISFLVTIVGTVLSVAITSMLSYPLSKKDLPGRRFFMFMVLFTMLFNGGLVSSYMMWTQTFHIKNSIWALILPNLMMNAFNVILMRSYYVTSIPNELYESAKLDGATEFGAFLRIALPLSKPILATIAFMQALNYWNDWQNGLYYINNTDMFGIQSVLNRLISEATFLNSSAGAKYAMTVGMKVPSTASKMAVAVLGMLPILAAYPFFQKFLVKGITLGGVKG